MDLAAAFGRIKQGVETLVADVEALEARNRDLKSRLAEGEGLITKAEKQQQMLRRIEKSRGRRRALDLPGAADLPGAGDPMVSNPLAPSPRDIAQNPLVEAVPVMEQNPLSGAD